MTSPILELRHLYKSFGAVQATKGLSMVLEPGELHALIGPNGAGKTTAVNQITGDILPDRGQILFKGREVTRMRAPGRARLGMARSFQITHIFENMSVEENLALAICAHAGHNFRFWRPGLSARVVRERLPGALDRVDLTRQAGLKAAHLSHGEKRQLEVGMALTGNPDLLILDEPMAGMGPGGTVEMTKLIRTLKGSLTILMVEHDMDVVFSLADRISVLVYGQAIASGSPGDIRENPDVRRAYLGEEA